MNQTPAVMDEDQVLAYTQGKRKFIVDELTKGDKIPDDRLEATLLMQALDGMDRAALTTKRIKADEQATAGIAGAASVVAKLLTQAASRKPGDIVDVEVRETPTLGDEIPTPSLVPGEIDVNPAQMDYESFTAGFQNNSNPSSDPKA